ncbi:methyltransferase [Actinomadura sp. NBRC 104412]|uniref:class I SAM-dependent methyltransferase n=1 Tax=Actinomadura sp. NBRC 104412 TaxID=3032203 RepID=UPI0024A3840D|nr:class I SAM-dependent methyltransferase [Actinomadura sp. NBRC 104412]GLZ07470.1 methyltransferase [Actinomadura sp. NBRC 104412]
MRIVNESQAEAWNGYEGRHWAEHHERYDAVNAGFNPFILDAARIGKEDRVLDLGCGNGQLTRVAARRARSATGIDLSAPMLARARERAAAEGVENVSFEQGDAQVHPFPAGGFEVAVSRFGIMFFADPVAAFRNVRRALAADGRLAFVCMTSLKDTDLGTLFAAMSEFLPPPTGPDGHGPLSFSDPGHIREVLESAGFRDVTSTRVEADQRWGRDAQDATAFLAGWGPVQYNLGLIEPAAAEKAREALGRAVERFERPEGVVTKGTGWLVTARR